MLNFIVLGQIPGTGIQLGFVGYMILFDIVLAFYILRKYHPEKLQKLDNKFHLSNRVKNLEKKLQKKLIHIRDDVLGPKLKFLK